jgi:hypothetical protein
VVSRQTLNMEDRTIRLEDRFLLKTGLTIEEMDDLFEAPPAPPAPGQPEEDEAAQQADPFTAGSGVQA